MHLSCLTSGRASVDMPADTSASTATTSAWRATMTSPWPGAAERRDGAAGGRIGPARGTFWRGPLLATGPSCDAWRAEDHERSACGPLCAQGRCADGLRYRGDTMKNESRMSTSPSRAVWPTKRKRAGRISTAQSPRPSASSCRLICGSGFPVAALALAGRLVRCEHAPSRHRAGPPRWPWPGGHDRNPRRLQLVAAGTWRAMRPACRGSSRRTCRATRNRRCCTRW